MLGAVLSRVVEAPKDCRLLFFLPALWFFRFFAGAVDGLDPLQAWFVTE